MSLRVIFVCDGDTDYAFLQKIFQVDSALNQLDIEILRPEDVNLKRRTGGGHKTLLNEAQIAVMKAAQGYADGVFVLVDNDGDPRFVFPHTPHCNNCRECDVLQKMGKVTWGKDVKKGASILYQAVETMLLSTTTSFSPQLETTLYGSDLKKRLYGREIQDLQESFKAFQTRLDELHIADIKAKTYPYLKQKLHQLIDL